MINIEDQLRKKRGRIRSIDEEAIAPLKKSESYMRRHEILKQKRRKSILLPESRERSEEREEGRGQTKKKRGERTRKERTYLVLLRICKNLCDLRAQLTTK